MINWNVDEHYKSLSLCTREFNGRVEYSPQYVSKSIPECDSVDSCGYLIHIYVSKHIYYLYLNLVAINILY